MIGAVTFLGIGLISFFLSFLIYKSLIRKNEKYAFVVSAISFLVIGAGIFFGLLYLFLLNFHR